MMSISWLRVVGGQTRPVLHKAYPGTLAACTGVAARMEGTIVHRVTRPDRIVDRPDTDRPPIWCDAGRRRCFTVTARPGSSTKPRTSGRRVASPKGLRSFAEAVP